MTPASSVAAVLLAAGASTRLGQPKQLLPYQNTTLIRHAARQALDAGCTPTLVVLGHQAESIAPQLNDLPITTVHNPNWPTGMASSIHTGIDAISPLPQVEAVLLLLCDQPLVSADFLRTLIRHHAEHRPLITATAYGNSLGVPALFARGLFPELQSLTGTEGAKRLIIRDPARVTSLPFPAAAVDIDTPADYEKLTTTHAPAP